MGAPDSTRTDPPFPWVGLLTLAALIFTSVTSEVLPTGLLLDISHDLNVSESQVGLLITLFAGTVVVSAAPLTALTRRYPRKALVITVLIVFAIGNGLSAFAPTFEVLAASRVVSGLAHGLFWAVVGAYAGHLVPQHRIGRAVAITSGGATAAFVLGVPLGTALGHALGWRVAFGAIGIVVIALSIVVLRFLPAVDHIEKLATGEIAVPLRKDRSVPGVVIVCIVVLLLITGNNIFYTYIAPFLTGPLGFESSAVAGMLFLYGGAGAIGLLLAGLLSDRFPQSGLIVAIAVVVVSTIGIGLAPVLPWMIIPLFVVWGIAFGGTPAMLQTRFLRTASMRMRDVGSAYLTTSFNIGIGVGALVGGVLLDQIGVAVLPFVGALLLVSALVVAVVGEVWLRRRDTARR